MKLVNAASFIYHQHTVTATKLTFLRAPVNYARLMQVPLIPAEKLDPDANLVIKMIIGTDIDIGQGESDPSYVISDGQFFVGVQILDKNNYKTLSPCNLLEGSSGNRKGNDLRSGSSLPKPTESYYPGRVETKLSLSDRWGTCFTSHDGGFSSEMIFQHKLNSQKGLFLEIYADDISEKVGVKYIEVTIVRES